MTTFNKKLPGRTILTTLAVVLLAISTISLIPLPLHAATGIDAIKGGINSVADPTGLTIAKDKADTEGVLSLVGSIVNTLLGFLGAAFLILVLYAGGIWMFAMGDSKKVSKAQDIIKTASIGLAVIVLSFFIVNLVLNIIGQVSGGGTTDPCGGACVSPKQCKELTPGNWACN